MANITPGKVKRRVQAKAPKIADTSDMSGVNKLQASVERGANEINRGVQNLARGIENLGAGLQASRDRIKLNQDKVHALEIEYGITADANQLMDDIVTSGEDPTKMLDSYVNGFQSIQSRYEADKSEGSRALAREHIQAIRLKQTVSLQNKIIDLQNEKKVFLNQQALENGKNSVQNNPSVHNYMGERMILQRKIDTSYHLPPHARDALKQAGDDSLGRAFFMGKQPQTAVELLDNMRSEIKAGTETDENAVYGNMTTDARDLLEKDLIARAKAFKKRQEEEDKQHDDELIRKAQKDTFVSPDSYKALTKDGATAIEKLQRDKGKTTKAETVAAQYSETSEWLRLHEAPASVTNAEIIKRVDDPKDQEHFMSVRDQYKKATLGNVEYKNMLKNMADDWGNGKFGKGFEGQRAYSDQRRTFERYMIETPDADAREYYDRLMDPINAKYYDNFSWGADTDVSPEDVEIARQIESAVLDMEPAERESARAWVSAARIDNPDYTPAELLDYYNANIKGRK